VVFPELLRGVFARDAGKDLLSACAIAASDHVLCSSENGVGDQRWKGGNTWMFILEGRQVVDVLVDSNEQIVWLVVRRDICLREGLRHLALCNVSQILPKSNAVSREKVQSG
jgi:hypothetical protein